MDALYSSETLVTIYRCKAGQNAESHVVDLTNNSFVRHRLTVDTLTCNNSFVGHRLTVDTLICNNSFVRYLLTVDTLICNNSFVRHRLTVDTLTCIIHLFAIG